MSTPSSVTPVQQIGNLVRYWVHYDTVLSELNKQVRAAREMRRNYEQQVLQSLRANSMPNPVIQIAGGRITVVEEKHQQPLTFKTLEGLLHQYYQSRPGARDETTQILTFIKANRTVEASQALRRTNTPGPGPGPGPVPALPPS